MSTPNGTDSNQSNPWRSRAARHLAACWAAGTAILAAFPAHAETGTRYIHENGRTYVETTDFERVPETTVRTVQQQRTTYRTRYVTEYQETPRVVWAPVTEVRCEPRWHGLLNPFQAPYVAYHMVPRTRWEPVTSTVRTPVTYREVIPETEIVDVPKRELRFVEREVVRRVAVTPTIEPLRPVVTRPLEIQRTAPEVSRPVGVARLDGAPPHQGTTPATLGPTRATILR